MKHITLIFLFLSIFLSFFGFFAFTVPSISWMGVPSLIWSFVFSITTAILATT